MDPHWQLLQCREVHHEVLPGTGHHRQAALATTHLEWSTMKDRGVGDKFSFSLSLIWGRSLTSLGPQTRRLRVSKLKRLLSSSLLVWVESCCYIKHWRGKQLTKQNKMAFSGWRGLEWLPLFPPYLPWNSEGAQWKNCKTGWRLRPCLA